MDSHLLNTDIQDFIDKNLNADISKLALSKNPFPGNDFREIINQVAAKSKAKEKLPTWFETKQIIYPEKLSIEQASSEKAAEYKAGLIEGKSLIDLSGGFGVDDYFFAKRFQEVIHCEINAELSAIVKHNFAVLGTDNISCITGDGSLILQQLGRKFDWIYVDPARRSESKGKVFMLKDCLPNVSANLELYFQFSDQIMIKSAPLLDISAGLSELTHVAEIHVVAIANEVKELLWILKKSHTGKLRIFTVNIAKEKEFRFAFSPDDDAPVSYSEPLAYLYEPNSAILKSGGFKNVSSEFGLAKLHQHSHLYTSDKKKDFPGRVFRIEQNMKYGKDALKALKRIGKANIAVRNFPESVIQIRKATKLNDGGDVYCFFTTDKNDHKIVLICTKL